jgi:hypothetical protein
VKPGKLQLTLVFSLLALAIAYNAWVFLRPATRATSQGAERPLLESLQATGPTVTGEPAVEIIDPRTLPPVPDVILDRRPQWPRNPFINPQLPAVVTAKPLSTEKTAEPDLVVASILYSAQRRLAIVNGRIVRVGDRVGSAIVRDIEARAVIVESSGGTRQTLELRMPFGNAEAKPSGNAGAKAPALRETSR